MDQIDIGPNAVMAHMILDQMRSGPSGEWTD